MNFRLLLTVLLLLASSGLKAQTVRVFHEYTDRKFVLYANNSALYPVSLVLKLELSNMNFAHEKTSEFFVIPAKSSRFKIGELTVAQAFIPYTFDYRYFTTMGDANVANYDSTFQYDLPFQKGKKFLLNQGYNGTFSHQNKNALDFTMPVGTEIVAARDGIIVQIEKSNTKSCPYEKCGKFNNYIVVMHADNTFARYFHIEHDGTLLSVGDPVKKGDVIGWSGNVGWSGGPHLHFDCIVPSFENKNTIETLFRIDDGSTAVLLQPGTAYFRGY